MIAEIIQALRSLAIGAPSKRSTGFEADLQHRFASLRPNLSASEIQILKRNFLGRFSPMLSQLVPVELLRVFQRLVEGLTPQTICDPWPGIGLIVAAVQEVVNGATVYGITRNQSEALVGKIVAPDVFWKLGDSIEELRSLTQPIDLAVGILPFGLSEARSETVRCKDGSALNIRADFGGAILLAALARLSQDGIACFVVTPSFFWSARSARKYLDDIGCYMSGVFALPAGTFAPYTQVAGNLIVLSRKQPERLFVAQLSRDDKTNAQIIANFRGGVDTGVIESGRYVPAESFRTIEAVRLQDALGAGQKSFGAAPRSLAELALGIYRRHARDERDFDDAENAVFIPLLGNSGVVTSKTDRTLKPQNYAQVVIDPTLSDARFVAQFLNSNVGRQIRELQKIGGTIPHLNSDAIKSMSIFVPPLETQRRMLDIETQITAEENTLLDLQIELDEFRRDLWGDPRSADFVARRLESLSHRVSGNLKQHAVERLDQWFETLPFPLASILRAWQATAGEDFKTKHEHLLHFFEAAAVFFSVIFLSAFKSNDVLFETHKMKLMQALGEAGLSFHRPSFGTWKLVTEYLAKQTRLLLGGDNEGRALCAELFADPGLTLPEAVSRKEIATVLSAANKIRNDTAHGGVLGQEEARLLNEQLLGQVQKLREAMGDVWNEIQLIQPLRCVLRRGRFQTDFTVLMSSNSEFLTDTRQMMTCLDAEHLYLSNKRSGRALMLLPLVQFGPAPHSAKNACYFFNRLEHDGARFISYHFIEKPALTGHFDEATNTIKSLMTS